MAELEIIIKVFENKDIRLNRSISLFGKKRTVVGFWNNSIVLASEKPQTMPEAQVQIYTVEELREFYESGNLQGLIEL